MYILGIESSCDETAVAVLEVLPQDQCIIRANLISSQIDIHRVYGGVIPEIAARQHFEVLLPLIDEALYQAQIKAHQLSCIAVTRGPGLIGAVLVGLETGKAMAWALNIPWVAVNHLEGHLWSPCLRQMNIPAQILPTPHLALLASGGHTSLVWVQSWGEYKTLGSTRDDAVGEAFDKVGKMLGLGYPAGSSIDKLARQGQVGKYRLPKAMHQAKNGLDFSYSGVKTWMALHLQTNGIPDKANELADLCADFQQALVEQLIRKMVQALKLYPQAQALTVSGGVACNSALRQQLVLLGQHSNIPAFCPLPEYCTDNAAMIALAGYYKFKAGKTADAHVDATSRWKVEEAHAV